MIEATKHHYSFADLNVEECVIDQLSLASTPTVQRSTNTFTKIRRERSVSVVVSGAATTTTTTAPDRGAPIAPPPAAYVAVTDANFKAHRHQHGDCLAHPSGCDCEKVQRPTMGQDEAWQVMSMRFKAVHRDPAARSAGANGPRIKSVVKVLSCLPARSTGPAVLAVPSRVAQRLEPVGHDSRAGTVSRHGGARDARDVFPTSRTSLHPLPPRTTGGVRVSCLLDDMAGSTLLGVA